MACSAGPSAPFACCRAIPGESMSVQAVEEWNFLVWFYSFMQLSRKTLIFKLKVCCSCLLDSNFYAL